MRPPNSAYDTSMARSEARAREVLDGRIALPGDTVSATEFADLDDAGRDHIRRDLRRRGMTLHDNGTILVVVGDPARRR